MISLANELFILEFNLFLVVINIDFSFLYIRE